jgi:hypothetical protein
LATETRFGGLTLPVTLEPASTKPLASVRVARPSNEIDELPLKAEGAIGSTAAWPTDAKSITAIIDFIILAVNLVNPAIASLFSPVVRGLQSPEKPFCA